MSLWKLSDECHEGTVSVLGVDWFDEADHWHCPGLGDGWRCSCWCHTFGKVEGEAE